MDEKTQIHAFVQDLLISKNDNNRLSDQDSLLLSGRLQSIDAVEIVLFLEEKFGVDFAEVGFDQEQIDSVDAICILVKTCASRS